MMKSRSLTYIIPGLFLVVLTFHGNYNAIAQSYYIEGHISDQKTNVPIPFVNVFFNNTICWIVYKALKSPELFVGISSKTLTVSDIIKEGGKDKSNSVEHSLSDSAQGEIHRLEKYMIESRPYLDPSLSIYSLANQVNLSAKDLSVLINHTMRLHFFDFVNEYRKKHSLSAS